MRQDDKDREEHLRYVVNREFDRLMIARDAPVKARKFKAKNRQPGWNIPVPGGLTPPTDGDDNDGD